MAHEYSVQFHEWIESKINYAKKEIKKAENQNDSGNENYFNGQLQQLLDIRQYMTDHIDLDTQKYYR